MDVGIQLLDFLGLRCGSTVGEDQSVAGELVIARTVAEVSAIAQTGGAVRLGGIDRLVDEVPDEAALIVRVALQCRVFVQIADRVAHCVHVLAGDVRLLRIVLEIFLNHIGMLVHAGFDVGNVVVVAVLRHALVVHGAVRIDVVHVLVHGTEHIAGVGLVAERPNDHARVVVVAAHHAVDTVDAGAFPMCLASWNRGFGGDHVAGQAPAAMGFEIGLIDQVDAVLVAQIVPTFLVRIVRGADGVDVVTLAENHIIDHVLLGDGTAALGVELVTVRALEHDALAVKGHDAVFDAEATEADLLNGGFDDVAGLVDDVDFKFVQRWAFGAPRLEALQGTACERGIGVGVGRGLPYHVAFGILQRGRDGSGIGGVAHGQCGVKRGGAGLGVPIGFELHVLDMNVGLRRQFDGAEQSVQTPEVLVFKPGCAGILVAGDRYDVLSVMQQVGDIKLVGSESVLAVTCEQAVDPYVDCGCHSMEDDGDASSGLLGVRKTLGHNELLAVERHVIVFRNIRLQRILVAVPRILDIHVLVLQQACHLQMARNLGAAERGIIEVLSNEWLFAEVDVGSLHDFDAPFSVKALREIGVLATLRIMREALVVGMCRRAVDFEHSRVGQPRLGCVLNTIAVCHVSCFLSLLRCE